jgi:hypothetical protein
VEEGWRVALAYFQIRRPQGFIPIQAGPLSKCIVPSRDMLCAIRVEPIFVLLDV